MYSTLDGKNVQIQPKEKLIVILLSIFVRNHEQSESSLTHLNDDKYRKIHF